MLWHDKFSYDNIGEENVEVSTEVTKKFLSMLAQVSTPSADTAERNIMSMLNVSTESIDRVGRRENFLKTNFESLEGENSRPEKEIKNKNR